MDPLALAEEIKQSYAINLIGSSPHALKRLLSRFGDPDVPLQAKLGDVVKMRGPYLQALTIPKRGTTGWRDFARSVTGNLAPHGLEPEIGETLAELGFRRLYEFQEQAMQAILDDQHTLIVAGTGRGKTEGWLLPLFHYIIARKRDKIIDSIPPNGTKALLIYPTKALAQDQLKRLLNYLFRLNQKLEPTAQISVGIFDGDTPSRQSPDAKSYLFEAFRYFRCPIFDAKAVKCQSCGQHLLIPDQAHPSQPYTLALPRPECRSLAPLDFVSLTREDIIQGMPDIVLTNPDMLNLRLLNINGDDQRRFLVQQPKFIVLDEVHIYTEIFGSFTSFIIKRLRQERAILNQQQQGRDGTDELRFIAASATVANEEDLFSRLCNLPPSEISVVRESTVELSVPPVIQPSSAFAQSHFDMADLAASIHCLAAGHPIERQFSALFDLFDLSAATLPPIESGEEAVLESAAEHMFTKLTDIDTSSSDLDLIRELHRTLVEQPMTPFEFQSHLKQRFPAIDEEGLDNLLHNFIALGVFSGLLEGRAHLFAWPIDGYYTCLDCGRVYDADQAVCSHCGGENVHKDVICSQCGEEAVESWFCPHCRRLYPLSATVEGEDTYYRGRPCPCTGEPRPTLRVIWKPFYRCDQCGGVQRLSPSELDGKNPPECPRECGGRLRPMIALPWACKNGHPHFADQPPSTCECGAHTFVSAGLFDIDTGQRCAECRKDFLDAMPHEHNLIPGGDYQEYKMLDNSWGIRRPAEFPACVPCYHPRARYTKVGGGARYDTLMRSPANAAVTSAQYALRFVVGNASDSDLRQSLRGAKLLAFSDSYNDMEQLAQDFDDPERRTFIDQAGVAILECGDCSLKDLTVRVIQYLKQYSELLAGDRGQEEKGIDWLQHLGGLRQIEDEVEQRFLSGHYAFRPSHWPWLVREAIADVRLDAAVSDEELPIVAHLARFNRVTRQKLMSEFLQMMPNYAEILEQMEGRGIILATQIRGGELLHLNPAHLVCSLVDKAHPMPCDESRGQLRGLSTLEVETGNRAVTARFGEGHRNRAHLSHPRFSRVAYRLTHSRPLLLRSEVYKGDIKKEDRRKIEYSFKEGADIHFLSSGPAMEVGIDIGDLDLLLLYGTPPNINAYLQRIGRAGRRSKQSLVLSVSKRNPIDFYYYRQPLDLIKSTPQPVPLNEHNEEVMKVSLTWALLDFVAIHFWVPWRRQQSPDGVSYSDGQDWVPSYEDRPSDISPLTSLIYAVAAGDIEYGYPLKAISVIINDRRDQAYTYLADLLSYRCCDRCGAYVYGEAAQTCPVERCGGQPVRQADHYRDLINTVISEFPHRMVDFLEQFHRDLWARRKAYNRQAEDVQDELMRNQRLAQHRRRELNAQASRLMDKARAIDDLLQRLGRMSFAEAQAYSIEGRYAYQIRSVADVVEVIEYAADQDTGRVRAEPKAAREMGMAIKEYHPYATILSGRRKIFTRAAAFDDYRTDQLRDRLAETNVLADPLVCTTCGRMYADLNATECACGRPLQRMTLKVLRSAEVQSTKLGLGQDPESSARRLYPRDAFRLSNVNSEVRRTYANLTSQVVAFTPDRCFTLVDDRDEPCGMLDFGKIEVVTFANSCTVVYESGLRQPWPQLFEICGDEDCHGVIVQGRDHKLCALDPMGHQQAPRQVVRLGHLFGSQGLRLRLPNEPLAVTHALAHGLRMGLQMVGGVLVRNVNELLEGDTLYIYDSIQGGSGVTGLLVQPCGDEYRNFRVALNTAREVVESCNCHDGCPHCVYQYGCSAWNAPATLTRHGLRSRLRSGLHLRAITAPTVDDMTASPFPAWPPEEDRLRQSVWQATGQLELVLRQLVQYHYDVAFGEDWPQEAFTKEKLSRLRSLQSKEERQFARIQHLLTYVYLQDLLELINKQWALFQGLFEDGKRAKGQLTEKVQAIAKIRNPLAHNRAVPAEELQLAGECCDDVLAQLQDAL